MLLNTSYRTYSRIPLPSGFSASTAQITPPCFLTVACNTCRVSFCMPPNNAKNCRYSRPTELALIRTPRTFSSCWISFNCLCSCSCRQPIYATTSKPYVLYGRLHQPHPAGMVMLTAILAFRVDTLLASPHQPDHLVQRLDLFPNRPRPPRSQNLPTVRTNTQFTIEGHPFDLVILTLRPMPGLFFYLPTSPPYYTPSHTSYIARVVNRYIWWAQRDSNP